MPESKPVRLELDASPKITKSLQPNNNITSQGGEHSQSQLDAEVMDETGDINLKKK